MVQPEVSTLHVEVDRLAHCCLRVVALVIDDLFVSVGRTQLLNSCLLQQNVVLDQLNMDLLDTSNLYAAKSESRTDHLPYCFS